MKLIHIKNGDAILKDRIVKDVSVLIGGSKIVSVGKKSSKDAIVIDAKDCFVAPGFIDTHIHGEPREIFRNEVRHGTTSIVIAQSCAPLAAIYETIDRIKSFVETSPVGTNVLGVRLEGPYINARKAGAQDRRYIRKPAARQLDTIVKRCGALLRIMTIAPEIQGALPLIRSLKKKDIIASIGHSYATFGEARDGIAAGIGHATHLFNAMRGMDSREPGVVGAVLSARSVVAEIILDLVHVHASLFGLVIQTKGLDRTVLVTDSVKASRSAAIRLARGAYRFRDGRLAGSSLTMMGAVKNAVRSAGLDMASAVRLATANPARMLGIQRTKGSLAAGKDADIVIFDKNFEAQLTLIRGEVVYYKKNSLRHQTLATGPWQLATNVSITRRLCAA